MDEGHLQTVQAFAERDARGGPPRSHRVRVTRPRREQVATKQTRLEYAVVLLDACIIPDDQSEQWVARTSPGERRSLVEMQTLEESGDQCVLADAKQTKLLGAQWAMRDVMSSPFCKELMGEMEEYKGPFG